MTQAIVTDIEGTTTSVSFVFDVLFPYARTRMTEFIDAHAGDPDVRQQLEAVRQEAGQDLNNKEVAELLVRWIDQDRKATPLKALQGMIWEAGYRNGDFTGHVYPDAVTCLRAWKEQGLALYVYSSGSVKAQKLLFGFSDAGDLTPLFSGYFDTHIGNKREAESYRRIAEQIGLPANQILFLSDIEAELDAARDADMQTVWLVRDGQTGESGHRQAMNFDAIQIDV